MLKACKKKGFNQDVYVEVDKYREKEPENEFWFDEPTITAKASVKLKKDAKPDKIIHLTLYFDC